MFPSYLTLWSEGLCTVSVKPIYSSVIVKPNPCLHFHILGFKECQNIDLCYFGHLINKFYSLLVIGNLFLTHSTTTKCHWPWILCAIYRSKTPINSVLASVFLWDGLKTNVSGHVVLMKTHFTFCNSVAICSMWYFLGVYRREDTVYVSMIKSCDRQKSLWFLPIVHF